jgi:hypothetical protein
MHAYPSQASRVQTFLSLLQNEGRAVLTRARTRRK